MNIDLMLYCLCGFVAGTFLGEVLAGWKLRKEIHKSYIHQCQCQTSNYCKNCQFKDDIDICEVCKGGKHR